MSHYLQYDFIIESTIARPKYFVPPDVSICFPYLQIINYSLAFTKLPGLRDALLYQLGPQFNSNGSEPLETIVRKNDSLLGFFHYYLHEQYAVNEIISVTSELDYLLSKCIAVVPGEYAVGPCANTSNFKIFVKDDLKCFQFTIGTVNGVQFQYNLRQLYYYQYPYVYLFRIQFTNIDPSMYRMAIYIHPAHRWPAGRTDIPLEIFFPAQNIGYNITFSRSMNKLLPAPYKADCHTYRDSRNQEIDRCTIRESLRKCGYVPPWMTLSANSSIRKIRRTTISAKDNDIFLNISHTCFLYFIKPDCVLEEFRPELISINKSQTINTFGIDINLPTSLDVVNVLKPARTEIDLFVYIVSVLGFWFGIYVASIFRVTQKVEKVKKIRLPFQKGSQGESGQDCELPSSH